MLLNYRIVSTCTQLLPWMYVKYVFGSKNLLPSLNSHQKQTVLTVWKMETEGIFKLYEFFSFLLKTLKLKSLILLVTIQFALFYSHCRKSRCPILIQCRQRGRAKFERKRYYRDPWQGAWGRWLVEGGTQRKGRSVPWQLRRTYSSWRGKL